MHRRSIELKNVSRQSVSGGRLEEELLTGFFIAAFNVFESRGCRLSDASGPVSEGDISNVDPCLSDGLMGGGLIELYWDQSSRR